MIFDILWVILVIATSLGLTAVFVGILNERDERRKRDCDCDH